MTLSSCDGSHYGETSRTHAGDIAMYTINLWMTYILLERGWKVNGLCSSTQKIRKCTRLWLSCQTDRWWKNFKDKPRLPAIKIQVRGSGHPFLSFIWPAVSSWDDQHFKLTRNGKRAPSQQDATVGQVYIIVLKTLIEEALPSVIEYLAGNLQLDKNNRQKPPFHHECCV